MRGNSLSDYVPKEYWQRRGKRYTGERISGEFERLSRWVKQLNPGSILEVGAGYGRIYRHLRKSYKGPITLCDFVDSFRARCQKMTGILPDWWDGRTLPYGDDSFDLVISFAVLNHVPAEDLNAVFAEHVRAAAKWIYIAVGIPAVSEGPNLRHDYCLLFEQHDLKLLKEKKPRETRGNWLLERQ